MRHVGEILARLAEGYDRIEQTEQLALVVAIRKLISSDSEPEIESICAQTSLLNFVKSISQFLTNVEY